MNIEHVHKDYRETVLEAEQLHQYNGELIKQLNNSRVRLHAIKKTARSLSAKNTQLEAANTVLMTRNLELQDRLDEYEKIKMIGLIQAIEPVENPETDAENVII